MNKKVIVLTSLLLSGFCGCTKTEGERRIEFWTDKDLSTTPFNQVYINGLQIDTFEKSNTVGGCGNDGNIPFDLPLNTIIEISLRNAVNDSLLIGTISTTSLSSGISVNTSNSSVGASLSVEGTSNEPCTAIKIDWE